MSHETVFAIASGKGGVGKTTATVNLGTALAGAGKRVAIVDVDLGMANLAGFVSLEPDTITLHDVLSGSASIDDATYQLAENIVAVPSGSDLDEYAETAPGELSACLETLRERFEYVLLDIGAGVSHETVLPLGLADAVLLITTPEPAAVHDAKKTLELTDRTGGSVEGVVINRTRPEGDISYEEIANRLETPLLATIPDDPAVRESVYAGTPLVVHEPESPAAVAYRKLAATLAGVDLAEPDRPASDDEHVADEHTTDDGTAVASHDDVSSAITEAEAEK